MVQARQADAIVLFGATGDLAKRMLLPSLYHLDLDGFLPDGFKVLATARHAMSRDEFAAYVREILAARPEGLDDAAWARFASRLDFTAADATTEAGARQLQPMLEGVRAPIFYLALSPSLYGRVCVALAA